MLINNKDMEREREAQRNTYFIGMILLRLDYALVLFAGYVTSIFFPLWL
jgi:hypothetical protein